MQWNQNYELVQVVFSRPQAGFNPPVQSKVWYQTTALPPSHRWIQEAVIHILFYFSKIAIMPIPQPEFKDK